MDEMHRPNPLNTDSERLLLIEQTVCDMNNRLFGNGKPGVIAEMLTDIGDLKNWKYRALGGFSIIIIVIELLRSGADFFHGK